MIVVVHGDNEIQIRKAVDDRKKQYGSSEIIVLTKPDLLTLRQHLATPTMFFDSRLTIVENLLQKGLPQEAINFLTSLEGSTNCIFVDYLRLDRLAVGKEKKQTLVRGKKLLDVLKMVQGVQVIACNDYSLFDFLDAVKPGNTKDLVARFDGLVAADYEAEAIFYMLGDHIRNLIIAQDLGMIGLSGIHEFRAKKMVSQSRSFALPKLFSFYQHLYTLEVAQKEKRLGAGSPFSMAEDLRFLLSQAL